MATQEILRERWEAIESGKLRGRRLFLPMEEGESEVRSLSFCYSDDESSGSKGQHHCTLKCAYSSSSSSSSPRMFGSSVDKGHEVKRVKDSMAAVKERRLFIGMSGNGGRYAVFLGGFTFALLIIAICMSSVMRSSGGCDHEAVLVPT